MFKVWFLSSNLTLLKDLIFWLNQFHVNCKSHFFNQWSFLGEISHPSNKEKKFMNGIKGFFYRKMHPYHQHVKIHKMFYFFSLQPKLSKPFFLQLLIHLPCKIWGKKKLLLTYYHYVSHKGFENIELFFVHVVT